MDSALICLAGEFSATGRSSMPRASRCSAGPTVGPRMLATSASDSAAKRTDGLDTQPVQLLLGHRPDTPEPAHRQPVEQNAFLVAGDHADAVGLGESRGDLGDLLARSGTDGGDQPGLSRTSARSLAERARPRCARRRRARRVRRTPRRTTAVRAPEPRAHGLENPAAGHPVDHTARRQHHRADADQPAGLMHRHRRPGTEDAGLVAGSGHHAASAEPADQHRPAPQGGPGQLLHGREERIHVQVQHPPPAGHAPADHVGVPPDAMALAWPSWRTRPGRTDPGRLDPARAVPQAGRPDRLRRRRQGGDRRRSGARERRDRDLGAAGSFGYGDVVVFGGRTARVTESVEVSRLGDRHPHAVADLDSVAGLAELEAGGQDLAGDQVAVRARPGSPARRAPRSPPRCGRTPRVRWTCATPAVRGCGPWPSPRPPAPG